MMKYILSIFVLFACTRSVAQTPGYMGKRFTIGYSNSLSPNVLGSLYTPSDIGIRPVLSHGLNLNYIIAKQREICLAAKFCRRRIDNSSYFSGMAVSPGRGFERYSSLEYSLGFRRFNRSKFAPIGAYSKWEGMLINGWINYKQYQTEEYDNTTSTYKIVTHNGGRVEFKGAGASFTRGRQRIFEDKLVVDFGFKGTLLLVWEEPTDDFYEADLASRVGTTLNLNPIANVFIGIGFLAF